MALNECAPVNRPDRVCRRGRRLLLFIENRADPPAPSGWVRQGRIAPDLADPRRKAGTAAERHERNNERPLHRLLRVVAAPLRRPKQNACERGACVLHRLLTTICVSAMAVGHSQSLRGSPRVRGNGSRAGLSLAPRGRELRPADGRRRESGRFLLRYGRRHGARLAIADR